jgi:hypothetical protein
MKNLKKLALFTLLFSSGSLYAESFVGGSLGYSFSGNLSSITANENTNYPLGTGVTYTGGLADDTMLFKGAHYTDVKLKDTLSGGLRLGHYFDQVPSLGLEIEGKYSQPNIKAQLVKITHPGFANMIGLWSSDPTGPTFGETFGQSSFTEDQLGAKVNLFQFNLNALYRYQGFKDLTPYLGVGPSLNILRITGSGWSGNIVDPFPSGGPFPGPDIHQTSVNIGANFKAGLEYKFDKDWGTGVEYHFNWSPIEVDAFRSAQHLKADYESHNLSLVLKRYF